MNGIWLLPTRRRTHLLSRWVDAAIRTGISSPGMILVQEDELYELRERYNKIALPLGWTFFGTKADGMADKVREIWPHCQTLDWVGLQCDDHVPQSLFWDRQLLESINGKNIISCDDGEQAPNRIAGVSIFSVPLMKEIGYLYPDGFWHTWVDNVWEDLGRATGCWDVRMDILVTHEHAFKTNRADETHVRAYERSEQDKERYECWKATEFPEAVRRIKEFQARGRRTKFDTLMHSIYKRAVAPFKKGTRHEAA